MVRCHLALQNLHLLPSAALADPVQEPQAGVSSRDRPAVRRCQHGVQADRVDAMCSMPVAQAEILPQPMLKLSPEGEGFTTPKWGQ